MKSPNHKSFPRPRIILMTAVAAIIGAATAAAQQSSSSESGSSTSTANPDRSSGSYKSSSTAGAGDTGSSSSGSYSSPTTNSSASASNPAASTSGSSTMTSSSGRLGWSDRRFVTKAADAGMTEVELATLATQRATSQEVRSFAEKLVQDHQQVNSELKQIASNRNVRLDDDDGKDRTYKRLSKQSGSEFDREFVEHMIDEHEKDIKLFEKASTEARDQEVRSFASKHVGHLREHLQTAQNLRQSLMPTGRDDDSSGRSTSSGSSSSSPDSSSSSSASPGTSSSAYPSSSSTSGSSNSSSSPSDSSSSGSRSTTP